MSVVMVALFSAWSASIAAAQSSAATPTLRSATALVGTARNPYQGIFDVPGRQPQRQGPAKPEPARSVICGMTVIKGDPRLDAGIAAPPRPGPSITPKMRIIEPKICR
jgi:hypothetical protein